jgi:hypothetical protein
MCELVVRGRPMFYSRGDTLLASELKSELFMFFAFTRVFWFKGLEVIRRRD